MPKEDKKGKSIEIPMTACVAVRSIAHFEPGGMARLPTSIAEANEVIREQKAGIQSSGKAWSGGTEISGIEVLTDTGDTAK